MLGRGLDSLRGGVPVFFVPKDQADDSWQWTCLKLEKNGVMKNPSHPTLMGPLENLSKSHKDSES